MTQGRGISDAVRESIEVWVTDEVMAILQNETKGTVSRWAMRNSKNWVRRGRRNLPAGGYERDYECKNTNGRVGLRVHTDASDEHIRYVTFRVDRKLIGGGVVNVPSVLVGHVTNRSRRIQDANFSASATETPRFRPFTTEEITKLSHSLEYGDRAIEDMFEERI